IASDALDAPGVTEREQRTKPLIPGEALDVETNGGVRLITQRQLAAGDDANSELAADLEGAGQAVEPIAIDDAHGPIPERMSAAYEVLGRGTALKEREVRAHVELDVAGTVGRLGADDDAR